MAMKQVGSRKLGEQSERESCQGGGPTTGVVAAHACSRWWDGWDVSWAAHLLGRGPTKSDESCWSTPAAETFSYGRGSSSKLNRSLGASVSILALSTINSSWCTHTEWEGARVTLDNAARGGCAPMEPARRSTAQPLLGRQPRGDTWVSVHVNTATPLAKPKGC